MEGWIKLHRKILDSALWIHLKHDQRSVMITCLLRATHKERKWIWKGKEITLNPGQLIISYKKFSAECGVSIQTLRTSISKLERHGFLTRESTRESTKLTICKWDDYQNIENQTNTQTNKRLTHDQHTTNTPLTTNKNDNKKENENNEEREIVNSAPSLEKVSEYFIQHKTTVMTIQQAKDAAKKFFNKYDATEWKMNGQQITRWTGLAANFISNYSANLKDQNGQPIQTGGVKPRYDEWK